MHTASPDTALASLHIANEVKFISPHSTLKNQSSNVHMRLLWKARSFLPSQWGSSLWGAFCSINYCASMSLLFMGSHLHILDLTLSLQLILIRSSLSSGWKFLLLPTPPFFLCSAHNERKFFYSKFNILHFQTEFHLLVFRDSAGKMPATVIPRFEKPN